MHKDIEKILITEEEIQAKVKELGALLTNEYEGKNPLVVGVLKGALPFMADLIKEMKIDLEIDFMDVSSYGNAMVSSGEVKIIKDLDTSVEGRDILFVEDIVDSGFTMGKLLERLKEMNVRSSEICTLTFKPNNFKGDYNVKYVGMNIGDEFIVGYGLDLDQKGRNLKGIYQKK